MSIEKILRDEAEHQTDAAAAAVLTAAANEITKLRHIIEKYQPRLCKLQVLENYGVDNWSGYDEAMEDCFGKEDEED